MTPGARHHGPPPAPLDRAATLLRYWRGREDHHAQMVAEAISWTTRDGQERRLEPGAYTKRKGPITEALLRRHLEGKVTLGQYQIDAAGNVHWLCLDLDDENHADEELPGALALFDGLGLRTVVERSSPGRFHVWLLLSGPLPAEAGYRFGLQVRARLFGVSPERVREAAERGEPAPAVPKREFFPKQADRGKDGFGNLVRLPLGLHQAKRVWSEVFDLAAELPTCSPARVSLALRRLERELPNPLEWLRPPMPERNVSERPHRIPPGQRGSFKSRRERAFAAISLQDLVARAMRDHGHHVGLIRVGEKVVCPFHGVEDGSSGRPALMVGGSRMDTAMCWSENCRLAGKHLTRLDFLMEITGDEDIGNALALLEHYAGLA